MEILIALWPHLTALAALTASAAASGHALLHKHHTRAIVGWVALIWLVPVIGVGLYVMLGINRVSRKAARLRGRPQLPERPLLEQAVDPVLRPLATLAGRVSRRPLESGNTVELLVDGDTAYPAMLDAIAAAERSVVLSMYIFDADEVGEQFCDALAAAVSRGLDVRVLIDGVGGLFSFPRSMSRRLRRAGVPEARFLWSLRPFRTALLNLRSHRKVLICDGLVAFTGGMNIRRDHMLALAPNPSPTRDLMVRVQGPVVCQLMEVFVTDWAFTTGESLSGEAFFPELPAAGAVLARALPDGPDEDFGVAVRIFTGALSSARHSVLILTPYFLPEDVLISALETAALKGVQVDVIVQSASNLPYINRAMMTELPGLLRHGVRVWMAPAPFDHSKLMVVDDVWLCLGSANWDARSLRLNFELNLECYDARLATQVGTIIRERRDRSQAVTLAELEARSLPQRLLDAALWLLRPYL